MQVAAGETQFTQAANATSFLAIAQPSKCRLQLVDLTGANCQRKATQQSFSHAGPLTPAKCSTGHTQCDVTMPRNVCNVSHAVHMCTAQSIKKCAGTLQAHTAAAPLPSEPIYIQRKQGMIVKEGQKQYNIFK
jgi:hypothetical protein